MKTCTTWRIINPNTAVGYGVEVINTLTTENKEEFDDYIKFLKENVGDALIYEHTDKTYTIEIKEKTNGLS